MNIKVNAQLLGIITGIIVQASALLWYISGLDNSIKNFEGQLAEQQIQIEKIDEALKALDKDLQLLGADQMLLNDRLKQINADHETLFKTDLYQKSDSMLSGEKRKY